MFNKSPTTCWKPDQNKKLTPLWYLQLDPAVSAKISTHQIECLQFDRSKLHWLRPETSIKDSHICNAFVSPQSKGCIPPQMKLNGSKWWIIFKIQSLFRNCLFGPSSLSSDSALFAESKGETLWTSDIWDLDPLILLVCGYKKKHNLFLVSCCHHVVLFQSYLVRFWVNLKQPSSGNKHHCLPLMLYLLNKQNDKTMYRW